jgi:hypothetical protein
MSVSDIIGAIGLAVSILGIPLTFILARRTRQRPELRYALDFDVILSPDSKLFDRGLFMTLGTYRIDSISRTRIALWNRRGDTINKGDILDSDPFRVQLAPDDEALQARVLSMSRKQVEAVATIDPAEPSSVQIDFSFLDVSDGAIIEIIHRGPSKPTVQGTLKGANIRDVGSVRLGPDTFKAAAQKSRIRRFFTRTPKFTLIPPVLMIFAFAAMAAVLIYLPTTYQSTHLFNVSHYRLNTINGQVSFARAIAHTQAFNNAGYTALSIVFIILLVVSGLGASLMLYRFLRVKLPWTIAAYQIQIEKLNVQNSVSSTLPK